MPLTVTDNVASVPRHRWDPRKSNSRSDTAALDNQMGKDAMTDFGLTAVNFTPTQSNGGAGGFSFGQAAATDINGAVRGFTTYGAIGGMTGNNAVAIYNAKGTMFHSWANARTLHPAVDANGSFAIRGHRSTQTRKRDGIWLSADFFQKYDIDLNFTRPTGSACFAGPLQGARCSIGARRAQAKPALPLQERLYQIIVRVSVDGREMDAAIDTGSPLQRR